MVSHAGIAPGGPERRFLVRAAFKAAFVILPPGPAPHRASFRTNVPLRKSWPAGDYPYVIDSRLRARLECPSLNSLRHWDQRVSVLQIRGLTEG